jgi:hypothetical protein
MALRRNSLIAGIVVAAALFPLPVQADDDTISGRKDHRSDYLDDNYIYDYMTHRDSITIGLGDATTSNLQIMHPTPWPSYINNTRIMITGQQGIDALDNMMQQGTAGGAAPAPAAAPSGSLTSGAN